MGRPTFTPRFEEAESVIRDRMLQGVDPKWRKEPGDFMYDAVAPAPLEVKQLQINQDQILKESFPQFAEGDAMDWHLERIGLERVRATPNRRTLAVTADPGATIPAGHIFISIVLDGDGNPLEFAVEESVHFDELSTKDVFLVCTQVGEFTNVPNGSQFILQPSIPGIKSIVDQGTVEVGANAESDESAWERYLEKVRDENTGGNRNDYKRWVESERADVARAKVIPRWDGRGTVKVVLVGADFSPALPAVVDDVQEYLDPGSTGLGDGLAPCGAQVTVVAAEGLEVNVTANLVLEPGATLQAVLDDFTQQLDQYLRTLVFYEDGNGSNFPVAFNQVGALLITTSGVMNYTDLQINGAAGDLSVSNEQAPVLGTVDLNE